MTFKVKQLLTITPVVLVLDQLTKWLVVEQLMIGERIPVISGFFDLVHFRNTGAAFGMFSGLASTYRVPFFYIIAVIAVVVLSLYFRSLGPDRRLESVALSLIFGGVAGNIVDRVRYGEVVDFLSFHLGQRMLFHIPLEWPAFNVADSAITVSMILLVISTLRGKPS